MQTGVWGWWYDTKPSWKNIADDLKKASDELKKENKGESETQTAGKDEGNAWEKMELAGKREKEQTKKMLRDKY
jgi:hypothetical protein